MKSIFMCLMALMITITTYAQQAEDDIITKINGDVVSGKVTEINDDNIKFVHQGETLVYSFKKSDINKIHFSSGRVEVFNASAAGSSAQAHLDADGQSSIASARNKIAILPMECLIDKQDAGVAMGYKVQTEAVNFLSNHSGIMQVQDPATTNALLIKAGMTKETIRGFSPAEICKVLDVEFIVQATITQDKTGTTASSSQSNYYDSKGKTTYNAGYNNNKTLYSNSGSSYGSGFSSTSDSYQTVVTMSAVDNTGKSVFSDSHRSFWAFDSAYKLALQYMLKRTPFYTK